MRIIKNVRSSEPQEQVSEYSNETHVLLNEREVDVDRSVQYEYDKVVVGDRLRYADVVASAFEFYSEEMKKEALDNIKVTTASGKVFYGDPVSRTDLSDAISLAEELGQTQTEWKLAEEFEGNKIAVITLDELKEARLLSLQAKSSIIGVSDEQ